MKRKPLIILFALFIAACLTAFVGCKEEEKPNTNPPDNTPVLQFEGATVSADNKIEISVGKDVKNVKLTDKVTVKEGYTWKLYANKMGLVEIPTKVAANVLTSELLDGDNEFTIIVSDKDGRETIVYELTIFRGHVITVYFQFNGKTVATKTAETNTTKKLDGWVDTSNLVAGYTFDYWTDRDGNRVDTLQIKEENVVLTAHMTPNRITVTLNVNGGEMQADANVSVTFGKTYKLPVPTKTGYKFTGWYYGSQPLSNETGIGSGYWNISQDVTVTAQWQACSYNVAISNANPDCGTAAGDGTYEYGKSVTVSATPNNGHTWAGWYKDNELVSSNKSYTFTMPNCDVHLEARWTTYTYTVSIRDSRYGNIQNEVPCTVGETVGLSQSKLQHSYNEFYVWQGWYDENDKLVGSNLDYTFTMPAKNVKFTAKWANCYVEFSTQGGNVTTTDDFLTVGQQVTFTATDYPLSSGYSEKTETFVGWNNEKGELVSTDRSYSVTIPSGDFNIYPVWTRYAYTYVMVNIDTNEQEERAPVNKRAGATFNFEVKSKDKTKAIEGYYDEEGKLISNDANYRFTMPAQDVKIFVKYHEYTVTLNLDHPNPDAVYTSYIASGGSYHHDKSTVAILPGKAVECYALSDYTYIWLGWYDENGTLLSADKEYEFTMPEKNVVCNARWLPNKLSIEGEHILIRNNYLTDGTVTLDIEFHSGTWCGWYNGDTLLTRELQLTVDPTIQNITYTAKTMSSPVTAQLELDSSGKASATYCDKIGDVSTLTFTPYLGYEFVGWYENDELVSTSATYGVTSTEEKHTYVAKAKVKDELANVEFTSTTTTCKITAVKDKTITEYVIANYVTSIGEEAFKGCTELTSLTISSSVTELNNYAFNGCNKLESLTYKGDNTMWNKISKKMYWSAKSKILIVQCANGVEIAVAPTDDGSSGRI